MEIFQERGSYGNFICEPGGKWCNGKDYGVEQFEGNLQEAKDGFVEYINTLMENTQLPDELKREVGFIEALSLLTYIGESNAVFPIVETMPGNPEIMVPMVRGTVKAHKKERFMTYIAHECYGGLRYDDILKAKNYRDVLREFADFVNHDMRPEGGPKVKFAFVQGNLDGWNSFSPGSAVWDKFDDPAYGYSGPEYTWKILEDVSVCRSWCDVHNY